MRTDSFLTCVLRLFSVLTFIEIVVTRKTRGCESFELNLRSHQGVQIEPVDGSRAEVKIEGKEFSSAGSEMKFQFKSYGDSGILFYGRKEDSFNDELIGLKLNNGHLYYTFKCSLAHARLRVATRHRLDDGKWHTVKFHRKGYRGFIEVDKITYFSHYQVNCGGFDSFVFGGIHPKDTSFINMALGKVDHFSGCIKQFGMLRMGSTTSVSVPMKFHINYSIVSTCH